jgi:thiamine-phosphate pyrophosphorylase
MTARQTAPPSRWLIADARLGDDFRRALRRVPPGGGILVLFEDLAPGRRQRLLRQILRKGRARGLTVLDGGSRAVARVHNVRELRGALLARTPLVLLSPLYPTRSHPGWRPLQRMRAAALARLARGRLIALGGMDAQRFRRVERLGFAGWAGIDAWR